MIQALLASLHLAHGIGRIVLGIEHVLGLPGHFLYERLGGAYVPTIVVAESLLGAAFYALSSVLEQTAAREEPVEQSMRVKLLVSLARRRRWLWGMLAGIAGYAMQFLALRRGSLALVQPIFVTGLVMALSGNAILHHHKITRRDWLANGAILGGVALFIGAAQPGPGEPRGSATGWLLLAGITSAALIGLIAYSRSSPRHRALALGVATGIAFGVTSAITERTSFRLGVSVGHAFSDWSPYVLVIVSIGGLLLNQSAFQAGELKWSLPAITVIEPLVAILIGQTLYHEHIATGFLPATGELVGLILMVLGVLVLAGGPALASGPHGPPPPDTDPARAPLSG